MKRSASASLCSILPVLSYSKNPSGLRDEEHLALSALRSQLSGEQLNFYSLTQIGCQLVAGKAVPVDFAHCSRATPHDSRIEKDNKPHDSFLGQRRGMSATRAPPKDETTASLSSRGNSYTYLCKLHPLRSSSPVLSKIQILEISFP